MRSLHILLPVLGSLLAIAEAAPTCLSTTGLPCDSSSTLKKRTHVKRATWLPAQGGCWSDNANGVRALEHGVGGSDDLTPDKCQSLCEVQGFSLAGVEFGRECYCGNTVFGNNRPTSGSLCNKPCSGDSTQNCGGPDAVYIYVKDSYPFTVGPASAVNSYNGYEKAQCWQDPNPILTSSPSPAIPADQMTVQRCIDGCAAAGFSSAGVEYGKECYCGNISFPAGSTADLDECDMPCLGDASEYCGGPNRILIYAKSGTDTTPTTPTGPWTPAQGGCWSDNVDQVRALEHPANGYDDLTPAKCQAICEAQGFNLAGVEYGRECFCGNTIMGNNRPSAGICNMACTGDSSQKCGGLNAINIYVKGNYQYTTGPAAVLDIYNGHYVTQCWQDSAGWRILKHQPTTIIPADEMTVQKCVDACQAAGFTSAGVEYGRECYCDNVTYPPGQSQDMGECNMPCTGDGSQFCGGPNRMLIYYKGPFRTYRGVIQVQDANTWATLGYISKHTVSGSGQFQYLPNEADALHVTFDGPQFPTFVNKIEVKAVDTDDTTYPFIGLVQGHDNLDSNLGPGSFHWSIFSTTNSNSGFTPQSVGNAFSSATGTDRTSESHVWNINLLNGLTSISWTNSDGSPATITPVAQNSALFVVGDIVQYTLHAQQVPTPIRLIFYERF